MFKNLKDIEKPAGKKFLNGDVFFCKVGKSWIRSKHFFKNNKKNGAIICLDFDGVVVDLSECKSHFLKENGFMIEPEESSRQKCLARGVPLKQYREISSLVATKHLMELSVEKGAIEGICYLNKSNDIYIVTSRNEKEAEAIISFMDFHEIIIDGILSVNDRSKLNSLAAISPHIFIDDSLNKLMDLLDKELKCIIELLSECRLFLYENITNKDESLCNLPIEKIKNWEEIKELVDDVIN
jgi:hypothetical protein